jgi:hypothetical protein
LYLEDKVFTSAFVGEEVFKPFPQFGGIHPYDIVDTGVISLRPLENCVADLLLVNDRCAVVQRLIADVEEKGSQTRRAPQLYTGGDPLDQGPAFLHRERSFFCLQ